MIQCLLGVRVSWQPFGMLTRFVPVGFLLLILVLLFGSLRSRELSKLIVVHAAFDMNRGVVGFGLVVRDFRGVLLASCVQHIRANFSPLIAEAMTILRGINLAFDSNLIPFVIEPDALAMVKLIEAKSPSLADIGLVIGEIVSKLDSIGCGSVQKKRCVLFVH